MMNKHSETIAGLAGPTLIAMGAFLLLNRKNMPELAAQMASNWSVIFLSGILLLVAGLAIVRVHNVWEAGWRGLVTLLGWLAVIGGITRILYPRQLAAMAGSIGDHPTAILFGAVALFVLGVYLTLKGYRLLD